jgi:hypothetical protein
MSDIPTNKQASGTVTGPRWCSRYSDSFWAGRSGDRIPVAARFSACYTIGTGSFPGVKRQGRGVNHPPPRLATRLKKEYIYTSNPRCAVMACGRVIFTFLYGTAVSVWLIIVLERSDRFYKIWYTPADYLIFIFC